MSILRFRPLGSHASGTDISSAVALTKPATGANSILMQTHTQNVRFTLDGTAPEAAVGFQLKAGDPPVILYIDDDTALKVIEEAATAVFEYQWGENADSG